MAVVNANTVIDALLSDPGDHQLPEVEELAGIIYRNAKAEVVRLEDRRNIESISTASKDEVSVNISDTKANIHIRVSRRQHKDVSITKLADVAAKAILDELRRDQT